MASRPSRKGAEASMLALLSCSWRRSGSACMGCSSAHSASSAACEHAAHSRRSAPTTAAPIHSRNLRTRLLYQPVSHPLLSEGLFST
ncbi:unnamed protein product [Euphydryas editha]|uniref:Secreted protein n=1 Tax=Euphydryas editha TaxID=104508 RepID=A0AAU9TSK6_EUPED|nr:unnamed protein product [Euphydryas editha]